MERPRTYAEQRPYADPPGRLDDLRGPTEGVIELPLTLDWGPHRTYDLAAEVDRRILYERVMREAATTEEVCRWVDGRTLQVVWPRLWLPERLRRSWEAVLPELRAPAALGIGPVLSEEEAVASKVAALFSRGEARDYLDVAAILDTGRYDQDRLQLLAARADPGFRLATFAEALAAIDRFPDEEFARYGMGPTETSLVRQTMRTWSRSVAVRAQTAPPLRRPSIGTDQGHDLPEPPRRGYGPDI